MKRFRFIAFALAFTMLFSSLTPAINTVYAAENVKIATSDIQPDNVIVNVAKKAIKFILKHKKLAAEVVESVAGQTVAKNFTKYYDVVCDALEPLLKYSDVPYQMVYDAVYRGLVAAGASNQVAVNIALAIKEGISWFV